MERLITIIVPVYNVERYLRKCVESLINQTYSNLEIILIDDGSTDNSGDICDKYAKKDKRIIVIHQKNAGVSSARNKGLELAHGKYIGFVDPDDYIELNMYEKMIENIIEQNCSISICGVRDIEEDTRKIIGETASKEENKINVEQFFQRILNGKNMTTSVWNKLFDKTIIKNIYFDEQMKIGEDFKWIFEILKNNPDIQIYDSNETLYNWVKRKKSAIQGRKYDEEMRKSVLLTYDIKDFIQIEYPNIYSYAIKCALFSSLLGFEKSKNTKYQIELKSNIKSLKMEFFKARDIKLIEKIKIIVRFRFKKLYKLLKYKKWK